MKILFSFCNTTETSDYYQKIGLSQLAMLNTDTSEVYFFKMPKQVKENGVTGIAKDANFFYVLTQSQTLPKLLKIDKNTFKTIKIKELKNVKDPHSLLVKDNKVLICSTGTNSIETYEKGNLDYKGTLWQHPNTTRKSDQVHLNSIFIFKGDLWVSCFGKKVGPKWSSAKNGYLINTKSNTKKYKIFHPHSTMAYKDDVYFCESTSGQLYKNGAMIKKSTKSYVRGLDVNDKHVVIGISSSRRQSKSTGKVNNPAERGKFSSKTGILVFNKTNKKTKYYDLTNFEKEIYDVLILQKNICDLPLEINGISKISELEKPKENLFVSKLIRNKESLEKEVIKRRKYISYLQSSRFFKFFSLLLKIEASFDKKRSHHV